ncbi:hypothetical protein ABW19_dt0205451 [Dactylella cylindrospora]|nr:hypothetical protein ABW19_dt0205451 [Dactylella cylindrospora]
MAAKKKSAVGVTPKRGPGRPKSQPAIDPEKKPVEAEPKAQDQGEAPEQDEITDTEINKRGSSLRSSAPTKTEQARKLNGVFSRAQSLNRKGEKYPTTVNIASRKAQRRIGTQETSPEGESEVKKDKPSKKRKAESEISRKGSKKSSKSSTNVSQIAVADIAQVPHTAGRPFPAEKYVEEIEVIQRDPVSSPRMAVCPFPAEKYVEEIKVIQRDPSSSRSAPSSEGNGNNGQNPNNGGSNQWSTTQGSIVGGRNTSEGSEENNNRESNSPEPEVRTRRPRRTEAQMLAEHANNLVGKLSQGRTLRSGRKFGK